jgi:hypothetical protein
LLAQLTPAQGFAAAQVRLQACPEPQEASHASSAVHLPVPGLQYCPDGQLTPLHGCAKQPATQAPPTQVCPLPQVFPAQGSLTATQAAWQVVPPPHLPAVALRQGSG